MTTFDQNQQRVETQYNVAGDLTISQTPQRTIPLQRPPRAEHFIGREKELTQLLTDLQPGRVVTLCGPGGIGKSALAAEAVWRLAPENDPPDHFPDGIIFHNFASQPQAEIALETIARTFGEEPKPTPAAAAQRALAGRRLLLLLDSAEDTDDLPAVLAVRGGCGVLVTSRSRSDALAERQDLAPLDSAEAVKLLQAWGRSQASDEVAVQRISDFVGRLPLAVRLVGRYLEQTGETAAEYLEWLEETPIEALSQGEQREENVAHLLEHSLAQVSETARQVLAVAGVLALAPFDRAVIMAALDMSGGEVRRALNQLVSYGLLRREEDRFAVSHALIHTYARRRLAVVGEVVQRVAGYYTDLVEEQSKLGPEGFARLDIEREHMMRVLAGNVEREAWEVAQNLVWGLASIDGYLNIQGHRTERIKALEFGLTAARALGDRRDEGVLIDNLGNTYKVLGQVERAIEHHEQALTIHREIGNRQEEINCLDHLGHAYRILGRYEQAIEYFERAGRFGSLGLVYIRLGRYEQAIKYIEQSLTKSRETGDRYREAFGLCDLGSAYRDQAQYERAIEYYQQALVIASEIGHREVEGMSSNGLGIAYWGLGQIERAIEYYQQALTILNEVGNRQEEGAVLSNLGFRHLSLGQLDQAIDYFERALSIHNKIGNLRNESGVLYGLGHAYRALGQVEKAIEYYQQALGSAQKIGDRELEGLLLVNLGNANRLIKRYEEGFADFDQAIELTPDNDWYHYERALTYLALNKPDPAQSDLSRAIDLARQTYQANPQNWRNTFNLALYTLVKGKTEVANQLYQEAIDGQPPQGLIREAVGDVADFLKLFPDHAQAQVMHELLQQHLE